MFAPFSKAYYLGRLYVEPHDGEQAAIHSSHHEEVNEQLYATGEGVERLDLPLVMKVGATHLSVTGDEAVPERTLAVPEDRLDAAGVDNPPTLREVLLAKRDVAAEFLSAEGPLA
ncbi:DUF5802 family protein [Halorarius halobius]|uniref:DUF5802 family protein n=1 Tax=Halorarius halobius TaxID=2962671 RepID=UPI0020CBEDFB|nr:DUF5802 family protein [Halorarius halobius]